MSALTPNDCILCDGTGERAGAECRNCGGEGQLPPQFKTARTQGGEPVLPINTENLPNADWVTHHMDPDEAIKLGQSLVNAGQEALED